MKKHKVGDRICYRTDDDRRVWGDIVRVQHEVIDGGIYAYKVLTDDGVEQRVLPAWIEYDLHTASEDASAALERWRELDREKAGLLDYLLGTLTYYAGQGASIVYVPRGALPGREARRDMRDLVDEYTTRRDEIRDRYRAPGT